jgi:CheY-like chemotaxis protein
LHDIQQSGSRAALLCDQMLTYAGKKAISLRRVNPDESMHTLVPVCENLLPEHAKVQWNLEAPDVEIRADATSLNQLVINLLRNAAESLGDDNRGEIQISSRVKSLNATDLSRLTPAAFRRPGKYWILEVGDNGCGIPPEALSRVFDPFYTTKFPGRGLGLAAARGLAQSFDGGISVTSQPGVGSIFRVMIPVTDEATKALADDTAVVSPAKTASFRGQGLIWIVDDEPLICQTVERVLTSWGFGVRSFTDGEIAARVFHEQRPKMSLLLLDVTMPHWSGPETLRHLRETDPSLRVVVMSGFDEEESLRHFEEQKVTGFIHKPFQIDQLQERLRLILGESV